MKIKLFLVSFLLNITISVAQTLPSYLPKNGLVGWWPFNGNANDESGNNNHGSIKGATLTTDRNGKVNSAYYFNNSSYISLKNIPSLNNTTNFSISVWEQINANTYYSQFLISRGWDQKSGHFHISYDIDSLKFNAQINQNWNIGSGQKNITSNKYTIPQANWKNIVATYDGVNFNIYIDGTLEKSTKYSYKLATSNDSIFFGKHGIYADYFLKGKLDEIGIWNRALNQQEINALSNEKPLCELSNIVINPQGSTTFCQGNYVNLTTTTGVNYTYEWYNNGQLINGATASFYKATASGNYTVKVIDGNCNANSTATTVTVNQYPSSEVSVSGNTTFCEGNTVTLTAQGSGTYLWNNGSTSKTITVSQTGNYGVAITSNGCLTNSNQITVTVNQNPTATITPQGNTIFCQGGFVNLIATGGTSYQWNTGASSSSISVMQSGTYTVTVFNTFGCQAKAYHSIIVNPLPNITLNGLDQYTFKNSSPTQLYASPIGGSFIGEGLQSSTFNPAIVSLGKKTVTYNYTDLQGCMASKSINTIIIDTIGNTCSTYDTLKIKVKLTTGIKTGQFTSMNVYPNPTSDVLIIETDDINGLKGYTYKIVDLQGKEIYKTFVTASKTEIALKSIGVKGIYILHIIDEVGQSIENKKIILE